MRNYFIAAGIFLLATAMLVTGCSNKAEQAQSTETNSKLKVVASVYPVYDFAKEVGGDKIDLSMIVQTGVEPHDFEPTPNDLIKIKSADIFLYHGANFEPWISKIVTTEILGNAKLVEISKNVVLLKITSEFDAAEHNQDKYNHSHKSGSDVDPHVWLDPVRAMTEVNDIAEAFAAHDASNALYYKGNAERFNNELAKLNEEFLKATVNAQGKELITSHAAFGYLADRYNLKQVAVMGLVPDAEPTPETIAGIIKLCRELKVKYIFTEAASSGKLMETIAQETGCRILTLNTVEMLTKDDITQNKNYLSVMRENLAAIKLAFADVP